jgi:hypothetical protein
MRLKASGAGESLRGSPAQYFFPQRARTCHAPFFPLSEFTSDRHLQLELCSQLPVILRPTGETQTAIGPSIYSTAKFFRATLNPLEYFPGRVSLHEYMVAILQRGCLPKRRLLPP